MQSLASLISSHDVTSSAGACNDWLPLLYYLFSPPPIMHCQTLLLILNQRDAVIYHDNSDPDLYTFFYICRHILKNIWLSVATRCV